jgi:hypothetical protein
MGRPPKIQGVHEAILVQRGTSPASLCLSTAMIWLSVKRDFFKGTSSG